MPRQNRVQPDQAILAHPARGTLTGNRGILDFDAEGRLGIARWRSKAWITCTLTHPRGKYQGPAPVRSWTPLFFLDEAVALAAGHRPCAYCRRDAYDRFRTAWTTATSTPPLAPQMDDALHAARVTRNRTQVRGRAEAADLPPGAFILWQDQPHLKLVDRITLYSPDSYGPSFTLPDGPVPVLTPAPTLAILRAGYCPALHQSASA